MEKLHAMNWSADEHAAARSDSMGNQSQGGKAGGKRERKTAGKLSQAGASRRSARGRFTGPFPGRICLRPARTGLSRKGRRSFGQRRGACAISRPPALNDQIGWPGNRYGWKSANQTEKRSGAEVDGEGQRPGGVSGHNQVFEQRADRETDVSGQGEVAVVDTTGAADKGGWGSAGNSERAQVCNESRLEERLRVDWLWVPRRARASWQRAPQSATPRREPAVFKPFRSSL